MFKFARLGPEDHGAAEHHTPADASVAAPIFAKPGFANKSWE
jgi:hypothetical protein